MDGEHDDKRGPVAIHRDGDGKQNIFEEAQREAQREAYVAEISARLRHVCQHLDDDEFARLVIDMAETRLRFSAIDSGGSGQRPTGSRSRHTTGQESGDAAP
jgi:hypothetical protein